MSESTYRPCRAGLTVPEDSCSRCGGRFFCEVIRTYNKKNPRPMPVVEDTTIEELKTENERLVALIGSINKCHETELAEKIELLQFVVARAERAEAAIKEISHIAFPTYIRVGQSEGRDLLFCSTKLSIIQQIIDKWRKGDSI